jgi:apolipoprotein D and lipocalin family protein
VRRHILYAPSKVSFLQVSHLLSEKSSSHYTLTLSLSHSLTLSLSHSHSHSLSLSLSSTMRSMHTLSSTIAAATVATVLLLTVSLTTTTTVLPVEAAGGPQPVAQLNLTQYLGVWYQMYGDVITQSTFSNNSYCATATYALNSNGSVSVFNSEHYKSIDGPYKNITGYAYYKDASKQGELTVVLQGTPFPAPYFVYLLGPVSNGQYEFAVVSDPSYFTLFVLARDVQQFNNMYDAKIRSWLSQNGWTSALNKPVAVPQDGCTYSPYPPKQ